MSTTSHCQCVGHAKQPVWMKVVCCISAPQPNNIPWCLMPRTEKWKDDVPVQFQLLILHAIHIRLHFASSPAESSWTRCRRRHQQGLNIFTICSPLIPVGVCLSYISLLECCFKRREVYRNGGHPPSAELAVVTVCQGLTSFNRKAIVSDFLKMKFLKGRFKFLHVGS